MQQNRGNNGSIYDLRRDLQRPSAPSQGGGSSRSAENNSRYGFNGEPLSFAPDRTANGTVRRTRTDNSIEFPAQPPRAPQNAPQRNRSRQMQQNPSQRPQAARKRRARSGQPPRNTAQQRYQNQHLRPAQQSRDPVRREKRKKRRMTRAAIKRRRMFRRLMAVATLLAVIAAGVYLTTTMLFKIGTIQVQTADGTVVQEAAGYTSDQILQTLGVQPEENIFSFDPGTKETALERQFPLLESIRVIRKYPNTVIVQVTEATPAYAMQTENGWLTLSDRFKILACEADQPKGLKTLYGGEVSTTTPGEQLSFAVQTADSSASVGAASASAAADPEEADKKMEALSTLQAKLEEYGMLDDVTRIEFADTDQMAFLYQDRISVLLGTLNDLDYKLDRARYVLTDADGKGVSPTDTGGLDFSHVSAASTTRKFYLAQGAPTLPSGYVVPEKTGQEAEAADGEQQAAENDENAQEAAQTEDNTLTDPDHMTANVDENPM